MKILFIGGTGLISTAVSKKLLDQKQELYLLNRGNANDKLPKGAHILIADINDKKAVRAAIEGLSFDVVVDWIAFTKDHVERDVSLFKGKTKQYVFISSASAYHKPILQYPITEEMPLYNPYWGYSDNKRVCEEYLKKQDAKDFAVTIIRPSHTYNDEKVIAIMKSWAHPYGVIDRILKGKRTIIPGDGTSLWTLTHNTDFADGFIPVLGNKAAYHETYHITSDFMYTWDQLHEMVCDALGVKPNIIHIPTDFIISIAPHLEGELKGDKIWSMVMDNAKIKAIAPKFKSTVDYRNVVKKAVKRYMDHPNLQTVDDEYEELMDEIIRRYQAKTK